MVETARSTESLSFRAEVQQLLNILAKSLYTDREIFLRELISNASDSLHRMQFVMLTERDVVDPEAELAIWVEADEEARTLTVRDTGVGMTREELIENLGTIAHSGAAAFLQQLEEGQRPADIIGQFGVGFYAVFMVADEVRVTTRSYQPEAEAWTWTSRGEEQYTLEPADKESRGTTVEIQLKEDADEFTSPWRLKQIVAKHSNYVSFPIYVEGEVANEQTAVWRQTPSEVSEEEYVEFYHQLTLRTDEPLLHAHLHTDVPVLIRSILYVPGELQAGPTRLRPDYGLRLYSKKILIQEHSKELLPEYLRFVEGVVDSDDIPLNISRETVQSNRIMRQIQRSLTKRVLKSLQEMADQRPEDYRAFWKEFGPFIKEGIASNPFSHDDLLPLLRFHSSKSGEELTTLDEYVERMGEEQTSIYYILADNLESARHSPHLDYFQANDLEVLYLVDPLDGFMIQSMRNYEGKSLQNIDAPDLDLPKAKEEAPEEEEAVASEEFDALTRRFKEALGGRVQEVRASQVLRDSPARLVSPTAGPERDLQRVRRLLEEDFEVPPQILELNRGHPLIRNLARLVERRPSAPVIDATIEQLFANLLLLEGMYPNPADMVPRIQELLQAATESPETE